MGKARDIWSAEGGSKAVHRPQPVRIAKGWDVVPEVLPSKQLAPRRRKYAVIHPNNRDAVAVPMGGQSYNPADADHQAALKVAVKKLERKRKADEKFMRTFTDGRGEKVNNNMSADFTWEEEVNESKLKPTKAKSAAVQQKEAKEKKKKERRRSKLSKDAAEREARRALPHRRHPKRDVINKEADEVDELLAAHEAAQAKKEKARLRRRAAKKDNLAIKHYGRHYHTPLVLDVAPTDKLVGSLRHMSGGYVHPALERMKSLEERNLVPARMRHTYNKRKVLKPKGEVHVKRESFGTMPETSF